MQLLTNIDRSTIQNSIISWYRAEGRVFYWRQNHLNEWEWLLLEMLLRKTQAATVNNIFPSIIKKYNNPIKLLLVTDYEIESDLFELGLFRQRRHALKMVASILLKEYGGKVPRDKKILLGLPHIGPYIANAVFCFCFGMRSAVVDMNVARIMARLSGKVIPNNAKLKWLWECAEYMLPDDNWVEYNYGLLDIGAVYCRSKNPKCFECALCKHCPKPLATDVCV